MPVYRQKKAIRFDQNRPVEMHFHDCDETWIITKGRCIAHKVDRAGNYEEFSLEAGDIWMVEAGVDHGCTPDPEVEIIPVIGSTPEGSTTKGHIYFKQEGYLPTMVLRKDVLPERGPEVKQCS